MTHAEWESLCDGCGRCCLNKLEEQETDRTYYTDVGLPAARRRQLPLQGLHEPRPARARLRHAHAAQHQPYLRGCRRPAPTGSWPTGHDLYWWHPLVSGDPETVHIAGVSVRGKVADTEENVPDDKLEDYIVSWPLRWPKGAKARG